jgi:hypothetical protein
MEESSSTPADGCAGEFNKLDDDQLMSMFPEEGSAPGSSENDGNNSDGGVKQRAGLVGASHAVFTEPSHFHMSRRIQSRREIIEERGYDPSPLFGCGTLEMLQYPSFLFSGRVPLPPAAAGDSLTAACRELCVPSWNFL